MRALRRSRAGQIALGTLGGICLATAVSIVLLWPSGGNPLSTVGGPGVDLETAEVVAVEEAACPDAPGSVCRSADVLLESGPDAEDVVSVQIGTGGLAPQVDVGDGVKVTNLSAPGMPATYGLSDFQRGTPMLLLAIAFALLVIGFGRLRGALSLVGLIGSLGIVLVYIVPAIRDGEPALAVALSGSLAVMLVTISLAHGLGAKSLAAMLGTAASLVLVVVLATVFTEWAHLSGLAIEETNYIARGGGISVQGLLLAGMVIGALGVLDDVTMSQSSTVMALRAANPSLTVGELYRRAIDVGRDHVSATVNTLVLAYVGASLPILLLFSSGGFGFFDSVNVEVIAREVVATLVGSIGLIAAVPLTTILAATLVVSLPQDTLADEADEPHFH